MVTADESVNTFGTPSSFGPPSVTVSWPSPSKTIGDLADPALNLTS
jgi:hypothetical protein